MKARANWIDWRLPHRLSRSSSVSVSLSCSFSVSQHGISSHSLVEVLLHLSPMSPTTARDTSYPVDACDIHHALLSTAEGVSWCLALTSFYFSITLSFLGTSVASHCHRWHSSMSTLLL